MRTRVKPDRPVNCYTVIDRDSMEPVTTETFAMRDHADARRFRLAGRNPDLDLGIGEYDCIGILDDVTDEQRNDDPGDYRGTYGIGAE